MYTFKMLNISNLVLGRISKLENNAFGYYQKLPSKNFNRHIRQPWSWIKFLKGYMDSSSKHNPFPYKHDGNR
jgi:hypothetical protein